MGYIFMFASTLCGVFCKPLQKKYQLGTQTISSSISIFMLLMCIAAICFFFFISGGNVYATKITLLFSLGLALLALFANIFTMLALGKTDIINTVIFSSAGVIIIPFLYGITFLNETINIYKIIAILLMLVAVVMPFFQKQIKKKTQLLGYLYCMILFLVGGLCTVLNKVYAITPAVSPNGVFCFWSNIFMVPFVLIYAFMGITKTEFCKNIKDIKVKDYIYAFISIILGNCATLFSLYALKYIPVSKYTIITSAISLSATAIISRIIFNEKIDKIKLTSIVCAILAIISNSIN